MISVRFQGKPFNITVIQVYAPTSKAEEAEDFFFNFIFKLYITVLVLPNIKMNPPQVYMRSPS